jgi:uncharacterized membrane protein YhaH (DUF805 family)
MKWYIKVIKQFSDFNGRASRKEYWMYTLINTLIEIGFIWFDQLIDPGFGMLSIIYSLAMMIPGVAVAVRRLHDVNKSGWMFLLNLLPIIGWIWLLVLFFTEGTKGENKFGSDPKEETI